MKVRLRFRRGGGRPTLVGQVTSAVERRRQARGIATGEAVLFWMDSEHEPKSVPVTLADQSASGIGIHVKNSLPVSESVWVLFPDGTNIRGVARHCTSGREGFRAGLQAVTEREPSSRPHPVWGTAHLKWLNKSGALVELVVAVRNASPGRLEVKTLEPVPCPSLVLLEGSTLQAFGCVRWRRKQKGYYLVQIELFGQVRTKPLEKSA